MSEALSINERRHQMLNLPVGKLIIKLAIPSIISMLVTSIYNMADTFFVSQLGTSASGAVGIIFSVMALIQAVSFTLGMGSGNQIAIALGNNDEKRAYRFVAVSFFTAFGFGVFVLVFGNLFADSLVYLLGSTPTIAPYAVTYARYIFFAAPFMMGCFVLNNLLRAQGFANYGMIGVAFGGILNMILDPILIFGFQMGIDGAGLSTMISQILSFLILYYLCQTRVDLIPIRFKNFTPDFKLYTSILYVGSPSLWRQGLQSISSILLNFAAAPYGDAAIAAFSIMARIMMFINSALIGFGQGFQPVCGFNYGAKRQDRVLDAFWFCVKVGTIFLTTLGILGFIFSKPIITVFRRDDLEVIRIGVKALRFQLLLLPFQAFVTMSNMFSQSIGYGFRASVIAMSRQGIFFIPCILLFPYFWGEAGLYLVQPIADILTLILSTIIISGIIKNFSKESFVVK